MSTTCWNLLFVLGTRSLWQSYNSHILTSIHTHHFLQEARSTKSKTNFIANVTVPGLGLGFPQYFKKLFENMSSTFKRLSETNIVLTGRNVTKDILTYNSSEDVSAGAVNEG